MARFETVVKELTKLKAVTRPRSLVDDDLDLQYAAMARGLVDLPESAIEQGCDAWALESPWFPTLAELRAKCLAQLPRSDRPALPPPKRRERNDKRWWYDWCVRKGDPITLERARELYPSMFYDDGSLCEVQHVDFNVDDRVEVPFRDSPAYHQVGQMTGPLGSVLRGLANAVYGETLYAESNAPRADDAPKDRGVPSPAEDPGDAVPDEIYELISNLERDVIRIGGKKATLIFRQRAKQRSPERQIAMLEEWLGRHETERLSQEQAEYLEAAEA